MCAVQGIAPGSLLMPVESSSGGASCMLHPGICLARLGLACAWYFSAVSWSMVIDRPICSMASCEASQGSHRFSVSLPAPTTNCLHTCTCCLAACGALQSCKVLCPVAEHDITRLVRHCMIDTLLNAPQPPQLTPSQHTGTPGLISEPRHQSTPRPIPFYQLQSCRD